MFLLLLSAKDRVKRMKRQATEQEKIFAHDVFDKGLITRIYKEFSKLKDDKANNLPSKKMSKSVEQMFYPRRYMDASKHIKNAQHYLEMQIK